MIRQLTLTVCLSLLVVACQRSGGSTATPTQRTQTSEAAGADEGSMTEAAGESAGESDEGAAKVGLMQRPTFFAVSNTCVSCLTLRCR